MSTGARFYSYGSTDTNNTVTYGSYSGYKIDWGYQVYKNEPKLTIIASLCEACGDVIPTVLGDEESNKKFGIILCHKCLNSRMTWIISKGVCKGLVIGDKVFTKPELISKFSGIQVIKKASIPLIEFDKDEVGYETWGNFLRSLSSI